MMKAVVENRHAALDGFVHDRRGVGGRSGVAEVMTPGAQGRGLRNGCTGRKPADAPATRVKKSLRLFGNSSSPCSIVLTREWAHPRRSCNTKLGVACVGGGRTGDAGCGALYARAREAWVR
jgi:hypothetical protein